MNKFFLAFALFATQTLQFAWTQTTVVLTPGPSTGKTGYANDVLTSPQGQPQSLVAAAWTYGGAPGVGRSFFDFDFSAIPANATIQSAYLDLYWDPTGSHVGHSTQSGSNEAYIQRVTSAWDPATLVWSNQPSTTTANQATIPASTSSSQDYPNIDVTGLVQDIFANPSSSHGFMIRLQNETPFRSLRFASSHNPDQSVRPALTITYLGGVDTSDCVTLKPGSALGKDAYYNSALPNLQQGNAQSLVAAAWTYSGPSGVGRSLIDFDLSAIPANATVTSARMGLFWDPTGGHVGHSSQTGSNEGRIRRVTSSWNESTVLWGNQPSFTMQNEAVIPQSVSNNDDYPNLDVTNLVLDMMANPGSSYGFMVMLATEQQFRSLRFASSDHPDSTLWPELEVCFDIAIAQDQPQPGFSFQIAPNPSDGTARAILSLDLPESVQFEVYDAAGKLVKRIAEMEIGTGQTVVDLDLSTLDSGIYMVRAYGERFSESKKIAILR